MRELLELKLENVHLDEHYFDIIISKAEKVYTHIDTKYIIEGVNSMNYPESIKYE